MRKKSNRYLFSLAGIVLVLAVVFWYKFVYHPADHVVDAYVVESPDGVRVNFVDSYRISVNAGNTRTPVYLESTHHRFHSLDARTGRVLTGEDLGDSVYVGRSRYAVWFLKGKSLIQLDPASGRECHRSGLASDKIHKIDFSIREDRVTILYPDGKTEQVKRADACGTEAVIPADDRSVADITFHGEGPRKTVMRSGKGMADDFLSPEILHARYFANRNLVNPNDAWTRAQIEVTRPILDPFGTVYIRHKQALNKPGDWISAVSGEPSVLWTVEAHLRGSFVLPDPDGFTILTDRSPLIFRQTAIHVNRSGKIDWKYSY